MDKESDVIKHQMEHTRAALADKLEQLECQVSDTVSGASDTVQKVRETMQDTYSGAMETVESVKNAVRETAASVSEALDLRKQVQKHPWTMMAGATAIGMGIGCLSNRVNISGSASEATTGMPSSARSRAMGWRRAESEEFMEHPPEEDLARMERGWGSQASLYQPALDKLKGLAIGTLFGAVRDVLATSLPDSVQSQIGEVIDNFTTSLGGKPIRGRVVPKSWMSRSREPSDAGEESWKSNPSGRSPARPRPSAMADIEE